MSSPHSNISKRHAGSAFCGSQRPENGTGVSLTARVAKSAKENTKELNHDGTAKQK